MPMVSVSPSSTMGVAFAGNLLTLFVFYEVLTLSAGSPPVPEFIQATQTASA